MVNLFCLCWWERESRLNVGLVKDTQLFTSNPTFLKPCLGWGIFIPHLAFGKEVKGYHKGTEKKKPKHHQQQKQTIHTHYLRAISVLGWPLVSVTHFEGRFWSGGLVSPQPPAWQWTPFWGDIIVFEGLEDQPILLKSVAPCVWGHLKKGYHFPFNTKRAYVDRNT